MGKREDVVKLCRRTSFCTVCNMVKKCFEFDKTPIGMSDDQVEDVWDWAEERGLFEEERKELEHERSMWDLQV